MPDLSAPDMAASVLDMSLDMASCGDMKCVALTATNRTTGLGPITSGGAAYDGYILVGDKGSLATSVDGITWTVGHFGANLATNSYSGVAASSTATNKYVAVGGAIAGLGGVAVYSPDATTWTQATGPAAAVDVLWDGSRYLTAGLGGEVCTSSDGAAWTCSTVASLAGTYPARLAYTGSVYVMVGGDGNGAPFGATSPDGATWTVQTSVAIATNLPLASVAYGNGLLVAGSYAGSGSANIITSSDGGKNWTRRASATIAAMADPIGEGFAAVGWTGKWWVAGGGQPFIISSDGMTWQPGSLVTNSSAIAMTTAGPRGMVALLADGQVVTVEK